LATQVLLTLLAPIGALILKPTGYGQQCQSSSYMHHELTAANLHLALVR